MIALFWMDKIETVPLNCSKPCLWTLPKSQQLYVAIFPLSLQTICKIKISTIHFSQKNGLKEVRFLYENQLASSFISDDELIT